MKDTEKRVIVVELTNEENCSKSWDENKDALIKEFPYRAVLKGFGGGYFRSIEEIQKFYSKFRGSEKITGCGKWEVE